MVLLMMLLQMVDIVLDVNEKTHFSLQRQERNSSDFIYNTCSYIMWGAYKDSSACLCTILF